MSLLFVNIQKVKEEILKTNGVKDFHHIHIWAISTTQNALTGHLVVSETLTNLEIAKIKDKLKHQLDHLNIQHTTLETEFENEKCEQAGC